jgi:hypothetical protein
LGNAIGEGKRNALRVDFDCQIRLEFHGANITSDAGLLAYRELDEALGLTTDVDELSIHDPRTGQNTQHSVTGMVRQSVYSRLAGYEDTNDAERLCVDPAMRRPPKKPVVSFACFEYQAASWTKPRRVVVKVEWHRGELYPRLGFIVTSLTWWAGDVVRFYNQRGTAEQWTKEGKYALKWTRLSCCRFVANQVRLQLFALAYNLGNFLRRLALPQTVQHWSLTTLREKLIKIGAKIVRHARYVTFQMAEVAIPRKLFRAILQRIARLKMKSPLPVPG